MKDALTAWEQADAGPDHRRKAAVAALDLARRVGERGCCEADAPYIAAIAKTYRYP